MGNSLHREANDGITCKACLPVICTTLESLFSSSFANLHLFCSYGSGYCLCSLSIVTFGLIIKNCVNGAGLALFTTELM